MKLVIDKPALDYIKEKGKVINIDLITSGSCCAKLTEPKVKFGNPKLIQKFDEYFVDDVQVYVNKFIRLKDDALTISLNKVLGIKSFYVTGVEII